MPADTTTPRNGSSPDAIREEIERTREDLAGTVDALHAKLDVKARVKAKATTDGGKPRPVVLAGTAVAVLAVAGLVWWRRR